MDFLNGFLDTAINAAEDWGRSALGITKPTAPAAQAANKGTDTTQRNAAESMPQHLWLILAGVLVLVVFMFRRR